MTDAIYGCDTCRTTIGRAGCPIHRDSATLVAQSHSWSVSTPILTHCQHGLDLRIHPRCYLCEPAARADTAALDGLTCEMCGDPASECSRPIVDAQALLAARSDTAALDAQLLLLIAECLVPLAFASSPDAGRRASRLLAIRAALGHR